MHVRAQPGTRIEETARLFDLIEQTVRSTIPPDQLDNIVDNIGLPFSGINMAYQNTGTIGPEDGDALISLKEDHAPTEDFIKQLRTILPQQFPGHDVLVPAGRHRLANSQFRPAGADRRAGHRQQSEGQLRLRHRPAQAHPHGLRHRRSAHPAGVQLSADQCRRRPHARRRSRADPARHRQQPVGHAFGQRPGAAEFLAEHRERRLLSDRRADAAIPHRHDVGPRQRADHVGGDADAAISGRACANHAGAEPGRRFALQRAAGHRHLRRRPGARSRRRLRRHRPHPAGDPQGRAARLLCRAARPGSHHDRAPTASSISGSPAPSCSSIW